MIKKDTATREGSKMNIQNNIVKKTGEDEYTVYVPIGTISKGWWRLGGEGWGIGSEPTQSGKTLKAAVRRLLDRQ
jgi:hypothetical protein